MAVDGHETNSPAICISIDTSSGLPQRFCNLTREVGSALRNGILSRLKESIESDQFFKRADTKSCIACFQTL
jgi:hypothetical protein